MRERQDEPEPVTIGRDVGDAALVELARTRAPVSRSPSSTIRPADGLAQPDDRLDELVLAVAGDAGDAEDLARPDLEVDAVDDLLPAVVLDGQALDRERRAGRVRLAAVDRQRDLAADHQLGEVLLVRLGRDPRRRRPCRAG